MSSVIFLVAVLVIALFALFLPRMRSVGLQEIDVEQLAQARGDHLILDVREQWEYDEGHVVGAQLIPVGQLSDRLDEVPRDTTIYVICRSGNRSMTASNILLEDGRKDIFNVQGGMLAWQAAQLPVSH